MGVRRGGKTLWSASVVDRFGPGRTTSGGWAFLYEAEPDRYTGWVGATRKNLVRGQAFVYDLAKQDLVSFDGATGHVLWTQNSSDPCFHPTDLDNESTVGVIDHPVRCPVTGTLTFTDLDVVPKGVTMSVEGYDPETGKTVKATGPTFACQSNAKDFKYVVATDYSGRKDATHRGTGLVSPCAADAAPATGGFAAAAIEESGLKVSDLSYVLSTPQGLVGYQLAGR